VEANATARFCRGCGAPLDGPAHDVPAAGPVRKTVTVMFADLAGSTSFEEKVDAETAREVIGRYHDLLRSTAERHRAGVTKYIGDGFMAVWGVPEVGPDDAAHAVDNAVELQERFVDLTARVAETHGVELALRVAVNTGEVVVGAGDADLVGDALNVGARLEAECPRGQVVVGEETWRSTRGHYRYESLGRVQVKGRTAPVAVYQWLDRQAEATDTAPFVGRADEVRRLQAVFDDAVAGRAARLVTVLGDPGVGKSRLAAEFIQARADTRVVAARCDVERTVALAPIIEVLRARDLETDVPASVPERDRLLRDLNGLATGDPGSVEENFWALRRFVEVLASDGPVLLVLDDIQWADTLLLDFIEHLVEWVKEVPVCVLALARPELREIRPDLVTASRWLSEALHLSGLDAGETAELAANVLGATRLPDDLLRRLPASTGGNPLFVRELIGMLAHDGVLVSEPAGWRLTIDVDAITVPPTIHALLASRLERLDAADRRILELASVIGTDFSLGTVRALAGSGAAGVQTSLDRLRRLELAQPSGAYLGDEPVWRFHHVLVRDVAYRRLLKSDRADLHERLADWVEAGGRSVAFDADEMIARHLEAARDYRLELGTVDERAGGLALRSARHYAASARRALDRDELVSAGAQAARGAALAADDAALHAELLLIGCEALLSAGDVVAGAPLVDDLERIARDALAPWSTCYRCQFVVYTDPDRLLEVDARLQGAIDEFARRNDSAGLAKAHRVRAGARARLGRIGDCELDLFEALNAARKSGDHRQITAALGAAPSAALWGPSPVPKAGGRCLDVVRMQRITTAAPSLEATSLRCLAVLELLRGRPVKARTMLADARQVVADLGLRHGLMETELFAGIIESMEGDQVAAEPHFRTALEGLDALGVGADAGLAAALLARSVLAQGRVEEADRHAAESQRLAGYNLKTAIAWRAVRGEILAAQGRHDEAGVIAREAVAVAAGTDLVLDHALACLSLSRVLDAVGDGKGANDARSDADALYAAKEVASAIGRPHSPAAPAPLPSPAAAPASRLPVTNECRKLMEEFNGAMRAGDVDGVLRSYADEFVYDDHRRISGAPVHGHDAMRAAITQVFVQYTRFDSRVLAVRGQRLALARNRYSDDDGNETTSFDVAETDDSGHVTYLSRFDDDDFDGAYRELVRRYCAGEGAADIEANTAEAEWILASAEMRGENPSGSPFPKLDTAVASSRTWNSAVCWLSPVWGVTRQDREAVGHDGEQYAWTRLAVVELRDGIVASVRHFELDDEGAAFAHAEELAAAAGSRLAVANRASEAWRAMFTALQAHDVEGGMAFFSDRVVYDDRRRLSGDPIRGKVGLKAATERVLEHYNHFEWRTLAVRGDQSCLHWSRWSDDAGNQTTWLHVSEIGDDGFLDYEARFDGDDFDTAYRELELRFYAAEGAAFAEAGTTQTEWILAVGRGDFDRAFDELTNPDLRVENRSRSAFSDRTAGEFRASLEELAAMLATVRTWNSAMCWVSPTYSVVRAERTGVGREGEEYSWSWLIVVEVRDGRNASMCLFDLQDEEAAFTHAEQRTGATSKMVLTNQSCEAVNALYRAFRANDADGVLRCFSDRLVYDDRRRLSGDPVRGQVELRAAAARILQQYNDFEFRLLAVRGEFLNLYWSRWSDDAGNQTTYLHVFEIDDDGQQVYEGRFDEDDFEGAYRELERRYYSGEGLPFAGAGGTATEWPLALNRGELDTVFGELSRADLRVENRSRALFTDRSANELRASFEQLNALVTSARTWNATASWVSADVLVNRLEREAVGLDGEDYAWTRLHVCEFQAGQLARVCQFEPGDEEAAFAYAAELAQASTSRLAVTNRSCETIQAIVAALRTADVDTAMAFFTERYVYDDRRRLTGDPVRGTTELRAAFERILLQYSEAEWHTLAVRGERLSLHWSRWSDGAGNETAYLHVFEVGDDGRMICEGRFDEDDFEGAYRELEQRYYAGEGAAFAEQGAIGTEWVTALNQGDFDRLFNELTDPDMRVENRSLSLFGDPSATDLRATFEELYAMVASARSWSSALEWVSPAWAVARFEREAVGHDGEIYSWARLQVIELRNGLLASLCRFEVDDEEAAFAHAEEQVRAASSRLAVTNRASQTWARVRRAMANRDIDAVARHYSDRIVYDDRRRFSGDPIRGTAEFLAAAQRVLEQYSDFEGSTLAVRGTHLALLRGRWSDASGNETVQLQVYEVGDDDQVVYEGRFDADDFEGAYTELERRYYAGEGAAFAEVGLRQADYIVAINRGDLDHAFGDFTTPDAYIENRSRSVFGDRTIGEFRTSVEELNAMVTSVTAWNSAICWLSPTWLVVRSEREAVGPDGELYTWSWLYVSEARGGRAASLCQFDVEDEEAAFAYAEERMRASSSRLAVTNRATQTGDELATAAGVRDVEAAVACYAEQFEYDDRRRLGGNPLDDLRTSHERILQQYNHFESRTQAVRGEHLHLVWTKWSNDSGYETTYLIVHEVGDDGRIAYEGRFDEDDFDGAYRELERRYYAGEGAAYAESGATVTEAVLALNRGEVDRFFDDFVAPEFRTQNRSHALFTDLSAAEFRNTLQELRAMVASVRVWSAAVCWLSPTWVVDRLERTAVGRDGEQYAWSMLLVTEVRAGRMASMCIFEVDDEEAAFAYAEERSAEPTTP
jgi:class 3 adenylate cyclase/ketosteroid isomerase-like protein